MGPDEYGTSADARARQGSFSATTDGGVAVGALGGSGAAFLQPVLMSAQARRR